MTGQLAKDGAVGRRGGAFLTEEDVLRSLACERCPGRFRGLAQGDHDQRATPREMAAAAIEREGDIVEPRRLSTAVNPFRQIAQLFTKGIVGLRGEGKQVIAARPEFGLGGRDVLLEDEMRVGSAQPERTQRGEARGLAGGQLPVAAFRIDKKRARFEIDVLVKPIEVKRRNQFAMLDAEQSLDGARNSRRG